MVKRFSVCRVNLNPTKGSEQAGSSPVLVVSPSSMNSKLNTVIIAPMTTKIRRWPTRVPIEHDEKQGEVALDQIRTIDKSRLGQTMGCLDSKYNAAVLSVLAEIFAE